MIYYFSATGNSEYIAKAVSEITGDKKLICINTELKKNLRRKYIQDTESVGFVIPVHYLNIPKIIEAFLDELTFLNYTAQYFYLILTYASFCGATDKNFSDILLSKGIILNSFFKIKMPSSYILGFSKTPKETRAGYIINKAGHMAAAAANMVLLKANNIDKPADFVTEPISNALNHMLLKYRSSARKFYADNNCTYCGLCEKICPDGCIVIIEKKPTWQNKTCAKCLACIHQCPKNAIQYGTVTRKKHRYYNPKAI
ncbi:MAG: EFR1 family ferrodoxin [Clostridiales bacterium]|jgi:flavodoxin/NAD-dependent dihydropyrimidine dehydrogenase PreA subunit|nr:EFR1 family ferrodoxin [Clostridiales bacterium]